MDRITLNIEKAELNANTVPHRHIAAHDAAAIHDVDGCMRTWGWRATIAGSLVGLILGAIFVANPFAAAELTFGVAGTLLICSIECAVVAGGFAASFAALHGQGILRDSTTELERMLVTGRRSADTGRRKEDRPPFASKSAW